MASNRDRSLNLISMLEKVDFGSNSCIGIQGFSRICMFMYILVHIYVCAVLCTLTRVSANDNRPKEYERHSV